MATGLRPGDLWRIRLPIAGCAVAMLLALSMAFAAHLQLTEARADRLLGERNLAAAQQRLAAIEAGQGEYLARLLRYRELAQRRGDGAEGRLEWLAQLRTAAARRHVNAPEAEFAPTLRVDPGVPGYPQLRSSRMQLRLLLLHDEDLLGLLAELRSRTRAHLHVRGCSMERIAAPARGSATIAPTLRAQCSIDWLSLHQEA